METTADRQLFLEVDHEQEGLHRRRYKLPEDFSLLYANEKLAGTTPFEFLKLEKEYEGGKIVANLATQIFKLAGVKSLELFPDSLVITHSPRIEPEYLDCGVVRAVKKVLTFNSTPPVRWVGFRVGDSKKVVS